MEVPRRLQPSSFTLSLPKLSSASLSSLGALKKVVKKERHQEARDETTVEDDQLGDETFSSEPETVESKVSVFVEAPADSSEVGDTSTVPRNLRLCSEDSFSEDSSMSEERLAEVAAEAKKKSEEEEAAAKERAAQRQQMAIEELVQSERNYLRMLQLSTVTIRNNLQKLEVGATDTLSV